MMTRRPWFTPYKWPETRPLAKQLFGSWSGVTGWQAGHHTVTVLSSAIDLYAAELTREATMLLAIVPQTRTPRNKDNALDQDPSV